MGHFGGGIRYYIYGHFFVRPEAHLYMIHNNQEFSLPTRPAWAYRWATPSLRDSEPEILKR